MWLLFLSQHFKYCLTFRSGHILTMGLFFPLFVWYDYNSQNTFWGNITYKVKLSATNSQHRFTISIIQTHSKTNNHYLSASTSWVYSHTKKETWGTTGSHFVWPNKMRTKEVKMFDCSLKFTMQCLFPFHRHKW